MTLKRISCLVVGLCAMQSYAYDFVNDGMAFTVTDAAKKEVVLEYDPMHPYTGDFVIPATTQNGTVTYNVVGTGFMCFYASTISSITFGENQTFIGDNTFYGCNNLTEVVIPERITKLGGSAFMYCANLERVTLPSGLTAIPEYAFNSCTNLSALVIPDGVTDVAYASLAYCESLESVVMGRGVKSVGKQAFFNSTVRRLEVRAEVPPTAAADAFPEDVLRNTELIVPEASVDAYRKADVWRDFAHINGSEELNPEPAAPLFAESFEGWDGGTTDWLPEGWDEVSKAEPPHDTYHTNGLNLTWEVTGQRWADEPQDGVCYARIENYFYSQNGVIVNGQQDEWLISPEVSIPDNGEALYFSLGYHPGWVLCDGKTLDFASITNVMEVHVSRDGGETWDMLWDCLPAARSLSRNELIEDLSSTACVWLPVRIGLHDYAGESIRFAFRYVGKGGASMNIDDVQIRQPRAGEEYPEYSDTTVDPSTFYAHYGIPEGCFFYGDNDDRYLLPGGVIMPAHTELTYANDSNVPADARFEWTYTDPEAYNLSYTNFSYKTATDKDLTFRTGSFNFSTLPQLKATFSLPTAERDTTVVFSRLIEESGRPSYWQVGGAPGEDYYGYDAEQRPKNSYGFSAYDQNLGASAGDVVIPEHVTLADGQEYTVTAIDAHAFERCYDLHSVTMPNTITEIGENAFWGCYRSADVGLTNIRMSDGLRRSGTSAFYGCGALKRVEIGDLANWCAVEFEDARANPLPWAKHLVVGGEEPDVLRIPDGVEEVKNFAFYNILGRRRVEFPAGLKTIGWSAFCFADDLKEVAFNADLQYITYGAFLMCPNITDVYCPGTVPPGAKDFYDYEFDESVTQTATLHVPAGCRDAYSSANLWGYFRNIKEDADGTDEGIDAIGLDAVPAAPLYDLQGRRVTQPAKGLYISGRRTLLPQ